MAFFEKNKNLYVVFILLLLALIPIIIRDPYYLHVMILVLLWSYLATCWSYMGRFGMVSLGHGAFVCIGAYSSGLLFLNFNLSPWIGMFIGAIASGLFGALIGFICYRAKLAGHYFGIVTLAVGALSYHVIVYFRKVTGGSLGISIPRVGFDPWNMQFAGDKVWSFYIILIFLALALLVWFLLDRSKFKLALVALRDDEDASASIGINTLKIKVFVTSLSTAMTAIGGTLYSQYMMLLNPDVMAGVEISLFIPFKVLLGGMHYLLGPTLGSGIMVLVEEYVRVAYGVRFLAYSDILYAMIIVLLIIYSPKGVIGLIETLIGKRKGIGAKKEDREMAA